MPRALWFVVSLLLVASAAHAAQGVHPGPLPTPIGPAPGGAPAPGDGGYGGMEGYATGSGYDTPAGSREGVDHGYGWGGGPGYSATPAAPRHGYGGGYGDPGYPRSPQAAYPSPRGYWQWVPAEPGDDEPYGQGSGMPRYPGFGDAYPPYGQEAPSYDRPGESYSGAYAPRSYEAYGSSDRGRGAPPGYRPDTYPPSSGGYTDPSLGGRSAGPGSQSARPEAGSRAPGGSP